MRLFVSFAPEDRELKDELLKHLAVLQRIGKVELWSVDQVRPGADWWQEIERALAQADVALLLLSADFLASDFLQDVEVPRLFQRREQAGLRVIPVLLRSCLWEVHPWLITLETFPKDRKPLASRHGDTRDRALTELAEEFAGLISPVIGSVTTSRASGPVRASAPTQPSVDTYNIQIHGSNIGALGAGTGVKVSGAANVFPSGSHAEPAGTVASQAASSAAAPAALTLRRVWGGLAAFFIALTLGYVFYVRPDQPCPKIGGNWLRPADNEALHIDQSACHVKLTWTHSVYRQAAEFDIDKTGGAGTDFRTEPDGSCTAELYVALIIDSPKRLRQLTKGTNGKCGLNTNLHEDFNLIPE